MKVLISNKISYLLYNVVLRNKTPSTVFSPNHIKRQKKQRHRQKQKSKAELPSYSYSYKKYKNNTYKNKEGKRGYSRNEIGKNLLLFRDFQISPHR